MESREIRSRYLEYFRKQGHTVVPSDSLVPKNDPTLLFTSAGMVQFKDHFLGRIKLDFTRATTCQKCLRTSDIDNVGMTARHHTFFEMLGNFSFGDYFKQDAIRWAWGFVHGELNLPEDKLYATVYEDDDEAIEYWQKEAGVKSDHIIRLGADSNFWNMGDTGPCGPCSEILVDQGESFSCGKPTCAPGCDCDRYLEIWNLVFTQFDRQADGSLLPLPRKNIDTGAGLERVAAVMQNTVSNFETDLLMPLIHFTEGLTDRKYNDSKKTTSSFRVIADHARALTFTFADGVLPSNEGRGYVIRRILRRAYRHGRLLGIEKPFLYQAADVVIDQMKDIYPEIKEKQQHIVQTILAEENRFEATLSSGISLLNDAIEKAQSEKQKEIPSETVFRLYDTYGFPPDLTREILEENNMLFNEKAFKEEVTHQQERSRASWAGSGEKGRSEVYKEVQRLHGDTPFTGYKTTNDTGKVLALINGGNMVEESHAGDEIELVADKTPFYAESGGQVGDKGTIKTSTGAEIQVNDTHKYVSGSVVHIGKVIKGSIRKDDTIDLAVDARNRHDTARNHTATHLLMGTLRQVLGSHVEQAGSMVSPDRLRFDFTHFKALIPEELESIEKIINERIIENLPVSWEEMGIEQARGKGALAFFGEKYGDIVRVVTVKDFDVELCGGTHLDATGDIGLFLITNSSAIGSGVRRIEAVTGRAAFDMVQQYRQSLKDSADLLKADMDEVPARIEKLLDENKNLKKQLDKAKTESTLDNLDQMISTATTVNDIKLIVQEVKDSDSKALLSIVDALKPKLKNTVVVLGTASDDKVFLITYVTPELTKKIQAGKVVGQIAKLVGGGGGGRSDMAQAGGKEPDKLPSALEQVPAIIQGFIK
jgi:alanyl-tRNA synthetase